MAKKIPLDLGAIVALVLFLIFIELNFNSTLASIYKGFATLTFIIFFYLLLTKNKFISINSTLKNTKKAIANGVIGLAVVIITTFLVSGFLSLFSTIEPVGPTKYFSMLQSSTPVLENNAFMTVVSWGFVIPILETMAFGYVFVLLILFVKIKINDYKNPKWIAIVAVLASSFAFFHLQAKGIEPIGLVSTFIFMVMTLVLISRDKEMESSIWAHIINNTLVVIFSLGLFSIFGG